MVYHYCPPIITYHNLHLHLPLPQGVLRGYVCCCNCNPGNHTPLYTVYCSYYNYTILYSLFYIHILQDLLLLQELGDEHIELVYIPLLPQEVPNHMQQVTEGKGGSLLLVSISSRCSPASTQAWSIPLPSMYFPNADKAQNTISSSPGRKRKWFLLSSRSTHNFIARSYSCISKVTTVIDSLPITWVVVSRALMKPVYSVSYSVGESGSREEQDQHWSCHKTTIATNWRLPMHVPGAFDVTLTMSSSKLKHPIIHAISVFLHFSVAGVDGLCLHSLFLFSGSGFLQVSFGHSTVSHNVCALDDRSSLIGGINGDFSNDSDL